jgi:hypothetical protein
MTPAQLENAKEEIMGVADTHQPLLLLHQTISVFSKITEKH